MSGPNHPTLREMTETVCIVAHREDTAKLESALKDEGFGVRIYRGPYTDAQLGYSAAMRCLVNHANVWKSVAAGEFGTKPVVVVEADFVPVRRFGRVPSPLPQAPANPSVGFAYLYSGGSIIYGIDAEGYPFGHGSTMVAYMLTSNAALQLLTFFDAEIRKNPTGRYAPFDTYLGIYLRKSCGILNYLPRYQLGEHGGIAQKEHFLNNLRPWHQADVLHRSLVFLPDYAAGSRLRYLLVRARAYCRGWVRLALGKQYDPRYINRATAKGRWYLAWYCLGRLLRAL
jgi:hypothetical protein